MSSTALAGALAGLSGLILGVGSGWVVWGQGVPATAAASPTPTVTVTASPATVTPSPTAATTTPQAAEPTLTAAPSASPAVHKLRGTFQLTVDRNPKFPENCHGFAEEGYGDFFVGQQVVVFDGDGNTLAVGRLARCEFWPLESPGQARGLRFRLIVPGLPERDFYRVQVGTGQRGEVTYSLADLQAAEWRVSLNL